MDGKPLRSSRMFWWNVLLLVLGLAASCGVLATGPFAALFGPVSLALLTTVGALGNIWLRTITSKPISSVT